jgi:hypothetical protein
MNRKQRKQMEKQLGITKMKKNMTNKERFAAMSDNIKSGNEMQVQMKETRRVQEQGKQDQVIAARISSIATDLMINHDMDYVSAQNEAKEQYKREVESASNTEN